MKNNKDVGENFRKLSLGNEDDDNVRNDEESLDSDVSDDEENSKKEQLDEIWHKLLFIQEPIHMPNRHQQLAKFRDACLLSIVACLLTKDDDSKDCERATMYLLGSFSEKKIEDYWYMLHSIDDGHAHEAILYGLIALQGCNCDLIRETGLKVLKSLVIDGMIRKRSDPGYIYPIFSFIKSMNKAAVEFHQAIKLWPSTIDDKRELVGWISLVNVANMIVSLINGEVEREDKSEGAYVIEESWRVLNFLVLHINNEYLKLLDLIFERVLNGYVTIHEPNEDTRYNPLLQEIYAKLLNPYAKPNEEINEDLIQTSFEGLDFTFKNFCCALLLRLLLEKPDLQVLANDMILVIEKFNPGARCWIERASLMDRLLQILRDSDDKSSHAILHCMYYLASNCTLVISPLEELLYKVTDCFTSSPFRHVQLIAGKCLVKYLEDYPICRGNYYGIKSHIINADLSFSGDAEIQQLVQLCIALIDSRLKA